MPVSTFLSNGSIEQASRGFFFTNPLKIWLSVVSPRYPSAEEVLIISLEARTTGPPPVIVFMFLEN